jgi:hypothetical protein
MFVNMRFQNSEPESLFSKIVSIVKKCNPLIQTKKVGIAHHLPVPTFTGKLEPQNLIVPRPMDQVFGIGIPESISFARFSSESDGISVAEDHVVDPVNLHHRRQGLTLIRSDGIRKD